MTLWSSSKISYMSILHDNAVLLWYSSNGLCNSGSIFAASSAL